MRLPRHALHGGILCGLLAGCYLSEDYSGGTPPDSGDPGGASTTEGGAAGQTTKSGAGGVSGFPSGAGKGGASAGKGGSPPTAGQGGAPSKAGQGGTVSAGTAGKNTAGSTGQGGSGGGTTMQPPCTQLALAHCQRLASECSLSYEAMGAQGLQQCQERTAAYCEAVRQLPGVPPDISLCAQRIASGQAARGCEGRYDPFFLCHLPGALPDGSPCANAAQCQGGLCQGQFAFCGTCATPREEGQPCGATLDEQCRAGLLCQDKVCTAPSPSGGPCTYVTECQQGLVCKDAKCQPALSIGATCAGFGECDERQGQYCTNMSCQAPAMSLDGKCGLLPQYVFCPLGQSCVIPIESFNGTCQTSAPDGGACDFFNSPCEPPAVCDQGTCRLVPACAK